jgi:hypothetical protein
MFHGQDLLGIIIQWLRHLEDKMLSVGRFDIETGALSDRFRAAT